MEAGRVEHKNIEAKQTAQKQTNLLLLLLLLTGLNSSHLLTTTGWRVENQ
jgi:hypothetical protein